MNKRESPLSQPVSTVRAVINGGNVYRYDGTTTTGLLVGSAAQGTLTLGGSAGVGSLYTVHYTRDKLGRITQKTETVQGAGTTYGYTYDLAGRLTGG